MTAPHHDLVIRPVTGPGELDLFCQLPYLLNEELAADLDNGHRRPGWLWMALDGDRLLARAAWWTRPGLEAPQRLDIFDVADHGLADLGLADHGGGPERLDAGERLLRAATSAMVPDGGKQSPREWWRIGTAPGGEPAGFVIPAHNRYNPIIAYIGVLPAFRGQGYIDELLAEGTRILAAAGVPRIRATTDVGNVPMARAFRRAGWADFGHEINMTWD
jgi:GNAT superfamily N-acetyltransferase